MTWKIKFKLNTVSSLILQVVTFICGFILPKMYLLYFGSDVNGLISSISQFLTVLAIADCGVGAVVQSALYKPLAEHDIDQISRVYIASEKYYNKIARILIAYVILLCFIFPRFSSVDFDKYYIASLILILSIGEISQYLLGIKNIVLLNSAQYGFVRSITSIITIVVNTVVCVLLMKLHASIHFVRFVSAMVYLARSIIFNIFVHRKFKINRKIDISDDPIKQKWNGLAQHISSVILGNTDVVVLTIFTTLRDVSIYSIYYMIVNGIKQIVLSLNAGAEPLLGDMIAKNDSKLLATFESFECAIHTLTCVLFTITGLTIVPFVRVYTNGITDANYIVPLFAAVLTTAIGVYCIRLPYNTMTIVAGHFKQTQASAIIEAVINIVVSVLAVMKFELVGVACGTLAAMLYRTVYLVLYTSKVILKRPLTAFFKCVVSDLIGISATVFVFRLFQPFFSMEAVSFLSWGIMAFKVGILTLCCILVPNLIVNRKQIRMIFSTFMG